MIWWGWSESAMAYDSFQSSELKERVRRFLDQIPLNLPKSR
jgi:hypothetical protein